ncbi:hypothetical protein HPB51_015477 [Rhipicephalus microplus]|uniref:Uncharacterized protein n=1 Tax=Rhipicephalus microplus TaxID=6941 RepID=A0A9J6EGY0_RHIMP|nr:hypothetical protein HPB51_015477 [Rhipicephalus microplus]
MTSPMDPKLAHLIEPHPSLQRRWKRMRDNRTLRKRIAHLGRESENYSQQLCAQQWHAFCNEILRAAIKEHEEDEVGRCLNDQYLSTSTHTRHPDYAGPGNLTLDADIEEWEVRHAVQALNWKSATRLNLIHNKALRNLNDAAITALTGYYNKCWRSDNLPECQQLQLRRVSTLPDCWNICDNFASATTAELRG